MARNIFNPTVEYVGQTRLFGNWMLLGGESLENDYALVWAVLSARIRPIASQVKGRYGLWLGERDPGRSFAYWTAVELPPGVPVPIGMAPVVIAPGPYLALTKDQGAGLGEIYDFIHNYWAAAQRDYVVNWGGLGFERYGPVGQSLDQVKIFIPLVDRPLRRA